MSKKNYDNHNRWRNKTVAFRVSSEEDLQLETMLNMQKLWNWKRRWMKSRITWRWNLRQNISA